MKTISRFSVTILAVAAAFGLQGCDWGVNGLDRMEDQYPTDAGPDVVDVGDDATQPDVTDDAGTDDTAVVDVVEDVAAEDATDANVWPDVSYEGIEGRWVARLVSNATMTVPLIGPAPMTTADLFIAEGTAGGMTLTFCDELITVQGNENFTTTTETKQALREAVAATPLLLAVSAGTIEGQEVFWKWAVSDTIADNVELPAADKDNEAVNFQNYPDIDEDSHPGVSISVSLNLYGLPTVGERYMAKRAKFNIQEASPSEDGRWMTGGLIFEVAEVVLGADQPLLNNGAAVAPAEEASFYQFRRVDDQMDCAALVAGHEGLFADAP